MLEFDLPKMDGEGPDRVTFSVNGETFQCAEVAPMAVVRHFSALLGDPNIRWGELGRAWEWLLDHDDGDDGKLSSAARFFALVEDPGYDADLGWLFGLWRDVAVEVAGRPTRPLPGSAGGPSGSGDGSAPSEETG